jgi:hypothetical protein
MTEAQLAWIIGIIVVLLVVGALSKAGENAKKAEEAKAFDQALQSRTAAETDRIRREAGSGPLGQLTDNEIKDLIAKSARELKQANDIGNGIGGFIAFLGIGFGIFAALSAEKWDPLFIFGGFGFGLGYLISQAIIKSAKKAISKRGLDPDRIEISA